MQKFWMGGLALVAFVALSMENVWADDAPYCREYTQAVTIGGIVRQTYGTACMQPDGSWQKSDQDNAAYDVGEDLQVTQVQQPIVVRQVVYEEPMYYRSPVVYPSLGLNFAFGDWDGRGRGGNWGHGGGHGGGWHGGHGRH